MEDTAEQVSTEQCLAIEFENVGAYRFMSVHFWRGKDLYRVLVCRSWLPSVNIAGERGSLARLLSVTSTQVDIVACLGCPVSMIQILNESSFFSRGVQCCFRFDHLILPILMHKIRYSIFRRIDFFSVLQCLMGSRGGSQTENWVLQSPELLRETLSSIAGNEGRK